MRLPKSVRGIEDFGRIRLSKSFFMRDFLYSEIAAEQGFLNLPDDGDLAVYVGSRLCRELLEPLQATFGRIALRSGYRSPEVNGFGNAHNLSCASNMRDAARHIWDQRAEDDAIGAMVTIVVPWLVDKIADGSAQWTSMAWWIHDNLPYSELQFFPKLSAFNIGWHESPRGGITSFPRPAGRLTKRG